MDLAKRRQAKATSRPQNLSLNEMFLVANTHPVGSQDFIDIFNLPSGCTRRMIAIINAAAAALSRNDLVIGRTLFRYGTLKY